MKYILLIFAILCIGCADSTDTPNTTDTEENKLIFAVFTPTESGWSAQIQTQKPLKDTDIEITSEIPVIFSDFQSYPHMGGTSECTFTLTSESEAITVNFPTLQKKVALTGEKRIALK